VILLTIPVAVVVILILVWLRNYRLKRIRSLAPGEYVLLFDSNLWFQNAVLALRSAGVIDPDTQTDSEHPTNGPRWASASSEALSFWRGYAGTPVFRLPWSRVSELSRSINSLPTTNGANRSTYGIEVTILSGGKPIHIFLEQPVALGAVSGRTRDVDTIVAELNRLRGAAPTSAPAS
jgi:hypothetical protein